MDNKTLRALVLNYKTKYKEGFIDDEIEDIKNKVEKEVFNFVGFNTFFDFCYNIFCASNPYFCAGNWRCQTKETMMRAAS